MRSAAAILLCLAACGHRSASDARLAVTAPDARLRARVQATAAAALHTVEARLGLRLDGPLAIFVAAPTDLPPGLRSSFHPWTVALASKDPFEIWVRLDRIRSAPPNDLRTVLQHELVHALLFQLEESGGRGRRLPLWLHEGLAQEISGGPVFADQAQLLAVRSAAGRFVSWRLLRDRLPEDAEEVRLAYAQCASFVSYLVARIGLREILESARLYLSGRADTLDGGLALLRWDSFARLQEEWRRWMVHGFGFVDFLGGRCFSILLILSVPLVFFVIRARSARERKAWERLLRYEAGEDGGGSGPDGDDGGAETGAGEGAENPPGGGGRSAGAPSAGLDLAPEDPRERESL